MEEGENIIKGIIKQSGVLISEFHTIAVKATSREAKDASLQRKENTEKIAERRRLNQFYKDVIRDLLRRPQGLHGAQAEDHRPRR